MSNLDFLVLRDRTLLLYLLTYSELESTRVAVFLAMFLHLQAFLGLFDSVLKFQEAFHELREGVSMIFLTITMAFLPNGCFLAETILKGFILFVLTAFTGIMGCMCAPMFLAQRTAFLKSHLLGDLVVAGIITLALTFLELSSGFLRAFFCSLFLRIGIHYNFFNVLKNNQAFWLRSC
jgi:hypothetical protein